MQKRRRARMFRDPHSPWGQVEDGAILCPAVIAACLSGDGATVTVPAFQVNTVPATSVIVTVEERKDRRSKKKFHIPSRRQQKQISKEFVRRQKRKTLIRHIPREDSV